MFLDTPLGPLNSSRDPYLLQGPLNLLDNYNFKCGKSENLEIRHCPIDQATSRFKWCSPLIDQAAVWLIRQLPDWNQAPPDWLGGFQTKIRPAAWLIRTLACEKSSLGFVYVPKCETIDVHIIEQKLVKPWETHIRLRLAKPHLCKCLRLIFFLSWYLTFLKSILFWRKKN